MPVTPEIAEHEPSTATAMTFPDFLMEHYEGNLSAFCQQHHVNRHALYEVLRGAKAPEFFPSAIQVIMRVTGLDVDTLFPPYLFLRKKYPSLRQSPGYARLKNFLRLSEKHGDTLSSRLRDAGFNHTNINCFFQVLNGMRGVSENKKIIQRILHTLQLPCTVTELLPLDEYGGPPGREVYDAKFIRGSAPHPKFFIEESGEAKRTLRQAPDGNEVCKKREDCVRMIHELVEALPEEERDVIVRRFNLNGKGKTILKHLGEEYGVEGERMRQIEEKTLQLLRRMWDRRASNEGIEQYGENDRVFI